MKGNNLTKEELQQAIQHIQAHPSYCMRVSWWQAIKWWFISKIKKYPVKIKWRG